MLPRISYVIQCPNCDKLISSEGIPKDAEDTIILCPECDAYFAVTYIPEIPRTWYCALIEEQESYRESQKIKQYTEYMDDLTRMRQLELPFEESEATKQC
jgi:transcription elongation factor Elf1